MAHPNLANQPEYQPSSPVPPYGAVGQQETLNFNRFPSNQVYSSASLYDNSFANKATADFDAMIRRSLTIKIFVTLAIMTFGSTCFTIALYFILLKAVFRVPDDDMETIRLLLPFLITAYSLVIAGAIGYVIITCINSCCRPRGKCGTMSLLVIGSLLSGIFFTGLSMIFSVVAFATAMFATVCVLVFCTFVAMCIKSQKSIWVMVGISVGTSQILWILYPMIFIWNLFGGYVGRTMANVVLPVILCLLYTLEMIIDVWYTMKVSSCSDWPEYVLKIYTDVVCLVVVFINLMSAGRR